MAYTTINKSTDYFSTTLYTSNSGSSPRTISGVGHNPDMIWVKNRDSGSYNHVLADKVRGTTNILYPDGSNAQVVNPVTGTITSTNSDGFVLTAGSSNLSNYDVGSNKEVVWSWKANGQGSSNTDGSINTTYTSANTTSGFSIVSYTGNGSAGATVGHGLGQTPSVFITKRLSGTSSWGMYHQSTGAGGFMEMNSTNALQSNSAYFNNTAPTSSVFSIGTDSINNTSGSTYIAYCFAEKTGFSKFGSYTGNGNADGAFVYTGFKPAWIMIKRYDSGTLDWNMYDNKRLGYNGGDAPLFANLSNAESNDLGRIDFLSNGFKIKTSNDQLANNGGKYLYMAFAEAPLVGSNNVPATAK